jgi:hypothetical protein
MIRAIPLTVLPLIAYNLVGYSLSGADPWAGEILALTLLSGASWSITRGDVLIAFAIAMVLFQVRRSLAARRGTVLRGIASMIVSGVYIVEFATASVAADSIFFILTALALFDVAAGMSIRAARREPAYDRDLDESR